MTGSIAHTDGYAVAVATRTTGRSGSFAVGIDVELVNGVTEDLFDVLFTRTERASLAASAADVRARRATIAFTAKEALYKAQYMLSGEWLDFHDVEVETDGHDTGVLRAVSEVPSWLTLNRFRSVRRGRLFLTAVVVRRDPHTT